MKGGVFVCDLLLWCLVVCVCVCVLCVCVVCDVTLSLVLT